jgi:Sulfotransferase domain
MALLAGNDGAARSAPFRIHVVGSSPRSGTTLMFELLTACFRIDKFGEHEVSLFSYPDHPEGPYASKKPTDFLHVCRLMRWDPQLHVIYMQRDPRDVITSRHNKHPGRYWCDFDVWQRNQSLLPRLAGHPRFFECRYEDLAADPDRVQADLAERFGFLQQRHPFSEFDKVVQSSEAAQLALNGVRKVSAASVGKWRSNLPRLAAQLHRFPEMAEAVVAAGYERDPAWISVVSGVEPDHSESVRTEHDPLRGKGRATRLALRMRRRLGTLAKEARYVLDHRSGA